MINIKYQRKRKYIEINEIFVVNVVGCMADSTCSEIEYVMNGK